MVNLGKVSTAIGGKATKLPKDYFKPTEFVGKNTNIIPNKGVAKAGGSAFGEGAKKFGQGAATAGKAVGGVAGKGIEKVGAKGAAAGGFLLGSLRSGNEVQSEASSGAVWFFIIASVLTHILDYRFGMFSTFFRLMIYIILTIFVVLTFQKSDLNIRKWAFLALALNLIVPLILTEIPRDIYVVLYLAVLCLPILPLYLWSKYKDQVRFIGVIGTLWIVLCIVLTVNFFVGENPEIIAQGIKPGDSTQPVNVLVKEWRDFLSSFKGETFRLVTEGPDQLKKAMDESMEYATGGYYHGQEEVVEEPLGVFLEKVEPTSELYFTGDKITIWGVLRARNIGRKPMDVVVDCGFSESWEFDSEKYTEEEYSAPIAYPEELSMEGYDQVNVDCAFEKGIPRWGSYDINLNATFSFETYGRLLTYWIDLDSARAITRENEKIHQVYGLSEEPLSYFTSGPVMIGMRLGKQPIKVGGNNNQDKPILGITIKSNWYEGKISKINKIDIYIPKELSLKHVSCSENVEPGFKTEGDFKIYTIIGTDRLQNIENYHTITCGFEELNKNILEPESPISLRFIKTKVEYEYVIYDGVEIEVELDPDREEDEIEDYDSAEDDEAGKMCSGEVNGFKYQCVPFKNIEDACSGTWSIRECSASGTQCCKTEI